jgi:hypothetical protein
MEHRGTSTAGSRVEASWTTHLVPREVSTMYRPAPGVRFFFGEGLSLQAKQRSVPPQKKTTGLPLAGPDQARSLRLSPSRSTACRRDPRRHRTQHPSCYLRQAPRYLPFNSPKQGRQPLAGLCWQEPGRRAPVPKALSPERPNWGSRAVNSTAFHTDALGNAITHRAPLLQRRRHRHR